MPIARKMAWLGEAEGELVGEIAKGGALLGLGEVLFWGAKGGKKFCG